MDKMIMKMEVSLHSSTDSNYIHPDQDKMIPNASTFLEPIAFCQDL